MPNQQITLRSGSFSRLASIARIVRNAGSCVGAAPLALLLVTSPVQAQRLFLPQVRKPPVLRPSGAPRRGAAARRLNVDSSEPEAVALLRQMLHPLVDYSAEEQTWIAQGGGTTSRQSIKGDTRGFLLRRYEAPPFLQGDVMLTGPNRYAYYRAATSTLTEVPPAGSEDERDQRIVQGINRRVFVARRTGNETVAGVNATIVLVTPVNPLQQGYAKFWIDPATGIRLKIEIANGENARVSASELSNLVIGAAANVSPKDFQPAHFARGVATQVRRQRVANLTEAMSQLPFHPLQPGSLPMGYRLDGIQIVHGPARVGVTLTYTDGVSFFTLTQHRVRAGARRAPGRAAGMASRWSVPMGDYDIEVVYRGHLPTQQEQTVHDSLEPAR